MRRKLWQLLVGNVWLVGIALCGLPAFAQGNGGQAVSTDSHLIVRTDEASYKVKVDLVPVGEALPGRPLNIPIVAGRHTIVGRRPDGNSSAAQSINLTAGSTGTITLQLLSAARPAETPRQAAAPGAQGRSCLGATIADLQSSIKSQALDRVDQNMRCRPENARDPQIAATVAELFAPERFASSRTFLGGLWKTRVGEAVDLCGAAKQAMGQQDPAAEQRGAGPQAQRDSLETTVNRDLAAGDFEALSWLFGHANPARIQGCSDFNDNLAQELFFLGKDVQEKGITKLAQSGMQLQYDGHSLFRDVYIEYLEEGGIGWQNATDATAPRDAQDFLAAKKQAEVAVLSTDPAFTGSINLEEMGPFAGPLQRGQEQQRKDVQARMGKYCPTVRGYCSQVNTTPAPEVHPEARLTQAPFTDPTTHLTWTARASEAPMNWPSAVKYCTNLHLANENWHLPTVKQLMSLYDISIIRTSGCKTDLHLRPEVDPWCGDVWSGDKSARRMDMGGFSVTYAWLFDFAKGSSREDPAPWISDVDIYQHYALCISDSQNISPDAVAFGTPRSNATASSTAAMPGAVRGAVSSDSPGRPGSTSSGPMTVDDLPPNEPRATLTKTSPTMDGHGRITAPGRGAHDYTVFYVDTRAFAQGGELDVIVKVDKNSAVSGSFDLFSNGTRFTQAGASTPPLTGKYDVAPGSIVHLLYRFTAGQVFALGAEGNWFSPKGATGNMIFRASVH